MSFAILPLTRHTQHTNNNNRFFVWGIDILGSLSLWPSASLSSFLLALLFFAATDAWPATTILFRLFLDLCILATYSYRTLSGGRTSMLRESVCEFYVERERESVCESEFVGMSLSIVCAYKTRPSSLFIGGQAALLLLLSMFERGLFGDLRSATDFVAENFVPLFMKSGAGLFYWGWRMFNPQFMKSGLGWTRQFFGRGGNFV